MRKERGFTIIELLIATTVFSLVLLIVTAGILEITRIYYRGVTQSRTQEVARQIMDEISESIRYSNAPLGFSAETDTEYGTLQLGGKQYTFTIGRQLRPEPENDSQIRHVLWYQEGAQAPANLAEPNPCSGIDPDPDVVAEQCQSPRELLAENMRLGAFSVEKIEVSSGGGGGEGGGGGGSSQYDYWKIDISVVYGDDDLFNESAPPYTCRSSDRGSEYCAVSNLSVIVNRRLHEDD